MVRWLGRLFSEKRMELSVVAQCIELVAASTGAFGLSQRPARNLRREDRGFKWPKQTCGLEALVSAPRRLGYLRVPKYERDGRLTVD